MTANATPRQTALSSRGSGGKIRKIDCGIGRLAEGIARRYGPRYSLYMGIPAPAAKKDIKSSCPLIT